MSAIAPAVASAPSRFGFSGSERRRQPERLQTCYEDHNAVRITGAYLKLAVNIVYAKRTIGLYESISTTLI